MIDPTDLYRLEPAGQETTSVPTLLVALTGFVDAGQVARLAGAQLCTASEPEVLARFDLDLLYDYRGRRPVMDFAEDHWEAFAAPTLDLVRLKDLTGQDYLLLMGPEPDLMWERFARAVVGLVERFGVERVISLHGIPMAVPHTRPVSLTAHATRTDLVSSHRSWVGRVQVPGNVTALLEIRLGEAGHDALGYAVHVPHYLSQGDYPDAATTVLEQAGAVAGLRLDLEALREQGRLVRAGIDEQIEGQPEVAAVVAGLESQYDAFLGATGRSLLSGTEESLPTAEELGAELERFLAEENERRTGDGR